MTSEFLRFPNLGRIARIQIQSLELANELTLCILELLLFSMSLLLSEKVQYNHIFRGSSQEFRLLLRSQGIFEEEN